MNNTKLLSICIPTYNRADKLRFSLTSILRQVKPFSNIIEVIVSDNASTDNTQDVLNDLKEEYNFLSFFKNNINLGPNLNFFKLSDEYATGKYFWLLGDDDVLDSNAVEIIINALQKNEGLPFLGLNFRVLSLNDITRFKEDEFCTTDILQLNMSSLINKQCRTENLLASFISCNIVLLERFKNYNKTIFSSDSWIDYKSLFPHTHIITSVVGPNEEVMFIEKPLLSVMTHEKEWDDKLILISLYYIVDVYKYYLLSGYKKKNIRNAKKIIINSGFAALIKGNVAFKYKIGFLKLSLSDPYFYELIIRKFIKKIIKL